MLFGLESNEITLKMLDKNLEKLGLLSALGYIFFSIVPYATAGKYIAAALVLIAFLLGCYRKGIDFKPRFVFEYATYAVVISASISALLNPGDTDASSAILKHALPFLLSWLIIKSQRLNAQQTILLVVSTVCVAYAYRVVMATYAGAANGFEYSAYVRPTPRFLDFFAADSIFYIPFLMGALFYLPLNKKFKAFLAVILSLGLLLVTLSGVRTSLVLTGATICWFALFRWWRYWRYMLVAGLIVLTSLTGTVWYLSDKPLVIASENSLTARYISLLHPKTYQTGNDWSLWERKAIAKGVWELSETAPVFGHGLGWQKLPEVAARKGYLDKWRASPEPIDKTLRDYFELGRGRVNPHNFYLTLFFEVGVVGLLAYASLLIALTTYLLKQILGKNDQFTKGIVVTGTAYILVTLVAGLAGGAWLPAALIALTGVASLMSSRRFDT